MSYNQIKWLILLVPTITVGLWEYVRHEYLLPYISMDLGNWLTPIIVLFVTFTLLTRFFKKLEQIQEELREERAVKAALEERERIASDLHDGMAQSLFLLSIKVRKLDQMDVKDADRKLFQELNESIHHIHDYIRRGIKNLKMPIDLTGITWGTGVEKILSAFKKDSNITVEKDIKINEDLLTTEEQSELIACIYEAFVNIQKHANASEVKMSIRIQPNEKFIRIEDNGKGFTDFDLQQSTTYGLKIMKNRCKKIHWQMEIKREANKTVLLFFRKLRFR